jgi:hypothetical protein
VVKGEDTKGQGKEDQQMHFRFALRLLDHLLFDLLEIFLGLDTKKSHEVSTKPAQRA